MIGYLVLAELGKFVLRLVERRRAAQWNQDAATDRQRAACRTGHQGQPRRARHRVDGRRRVRRAVRRRARRHRQGGRSAEGIERLKDAQELLWASDTYALLVVFQAMDAAGKDSTIKHVMSGVNPQGVQVVSFKQPSSEELDHTFLWRIAKACPSAAASGSSTAPSTKRSSRSEVHPGVARESSSCRPATAGPDFWAARYDDLNAFEQHLDRNGTKVVKFFLHVSKAEQKRRFMARLDNPNKLWKFSAGDVAVRRHWDDYMQAYEDAITATSTRVGAVVRAARRPQARDAGDDRGHPRRHHRGPRPAVADRLGRGPGGQRAGPRELEAEPE